MTGPMPKLPPATIQRRRLHAWFERNAPAPLRILTGPAGSGKTTAAVNYLLADPSNRVYIRLPEHCSEAELRATTARALGGEATGSHESLAAVILAASSAPLEIIFDELDNAEPSALADLATLAADTPVTLKLIYIARSQRLLDLSRKIAQGFVALCDAETLAFDATEIAQLADAFGIVYSHGEIARLMESTEGWAIVVAGVLRRCSVDARSLELGFEYWRKHDGRYFRTFIDDVLRSAPEDDQALLARVVGGAVGHDTQALAKLSETGLFIRAASDGYHPYRALVLLQGGIIPEREARAEATPLTVHLFGRFSAAIDGREIAWVRRRDQQIIKYLLLKSTFSATRQELMATFWPAADHHLASQSLRTACSNIRKAIALVVGYDRVERYLQIGANDVAIDPNALVSDARQFRAHFYDAEAHFQRGEYEVALGHYAAARRLRVEALLGDEPNEPWLLPIRTAFEETHVLALERMIEIYSERKDVKRARMCAEEILRLQPHNTQVRAFIARQFHPNEPHVPERRRLSLA